MNVIAGSRDEQTALFILILSRDRDVALETIIDFNFGYNSEITVAPVVLKILAG